MILNKYNILDKFALKATGLFITFFFAVLFKNCLERSLTIYLNIFIKLDALLVGNYLFSFYNACNMNL